MSYRFSWEKLSTSDSVAQLLGFSLLGQKAAFSLVPCQDVAHPQCCNWVLCYLRSCSLNECRIEAPFAGGWCPGGNGNIPEDDFFFLSLSLKKNNKKIKKLRRYNPIVLRVFPLSTKKALMLKSVCKSHSKCTMASLFN